jgi:hypothetical protein
VVSLYPFLFRNSPLKEVGYKHGATWSGRQPFSVPWDDMT